MTKAYLIGQVTVHNPEGYQKYAQHVPATLVPHGGKYLVRGGKDTQLEGQAQGLRKVVIEFPSRAAAEAWYHGPDTRPSCRIDWPIQRGTLFWSMGLTAKIQLPPP